MPRLSSLQASQSRRAFRDRPTSTTHSELLTSQANHPGEQQSIERRKKPSGRRKEEHGTLMVLINKERKPRGPDPLRGSPGLAGVSSTPSRKENRTRRNAHKLRERHDVTIVRLGPNHKVLGSVKVAVSLENDDVAVGRSAAEKRGKRHLRD